MKNKFKIITLFMSMMVIIAFASCKTETEYITKEYAASVTFTIEETTTEGTLAVVMATETKGAKIYYTVDNSVPSSESTEYTEKVTVNKDTVFKAIAIKEGVENSSISVATVLIKEKTVEVEVEKIVEKEIEKIVEVEKIVYSSEISETGLYTVYQIQQEKTGGKSIEDYEIFEVEENRTIEVGATLEDLKKSYEGFTAKILAQNENAIYVFYDRNTITYTFQTGTEGKFEDGTIEKEVSGLYGTTYKRPKAPTSADYNFSKWLDSDGNVAPTTFGAENKTFGASWKLKGEGGDEIPEGFVLVEAGTFQMGSNDGYDSNKPVHEVTITKDFYMGIYEVTQAEYEEFCSYGSSFPSSSYGDGDNYPAYNVSWYDALVYCNKRSETEGLTPCYSIDDSPNPEAWGEVPSTYNDPNRSKWDAAICNFEANGYRLPTEAEWEYAARAGDNTVDSLTYSGTSDVNELEKYAWYYDNSDSTTHEVGKKEANAYGLYDMSGNVWEWCWNWYTDSYNTTTEGGSDPTGSSAGSYRVYRGGSWNYYSGSCAVSYRNFNYPFGRGSLLGFRVVRASSN
mgnify:CR=1 FL=1